MTRYFIQDGFDKVDIPFEYLGEPKLDNVDELTKLEEFNFSIMVEVAPTVELSEYQNMEVEYQHPEVSSEEVEQRIEAVLNGQRKIVEADEDAGVSAGDMVLIKLKLTEYDEGVEEVLIDEEGTMYNTAADRFYGGLTDLILGAKRGESRSGEVTIDENSLMEEIKGKTCQADVEILTIQTSKAPSIDDYVAEKEIEGGAEGFKVQIQTEIEESRSEMAKNQSRIQILQKLVEGHEFDVPQSMVNKQLKDLLEELAMRQMYAGKDPSQIKFSDPEIEDMRSRARFAAKAACILASIATKEGLEVSEEEFNNKLEELAAMRGQTVQAITAYLHEENGIEALRVRILEEKTLNWLLEQASLVAPAAQTESEDLEAQPAEESAEESAEETAEETAEE